MSINPVSQSTHFECSVHLAFSEALPLMTDLNLANDISVMMPGVFGDTANETYIAMLNATRLTQYQTLVEMNLRQYEPLGTTGQYDDLYKIIVSYASPATIKMA
jgi:hypothetical protein